MKLILASLAAVPLLLSAPAASAVSDDSPVAVVDIAVQLELKVEELRAAFETKKPTAPIFDDALTLTDQWTDVETFRRERIKRAILDLQDRASRAALVQADIWRLHCQIVENKLCLNFRILWKQAKNRGATRADFERVAEMLEARAELAMVPQDLRERLNAALRQMKDEYLKSGAIPPEAQVTFDDDFVMSRIDRAMAWLEDMAARRTATREQFLYVKDLMTDRGRVWHEAVEFQTLVNRAHNEIDALMNRMLQGQPLDRSEFKQLLELCCQRAREVIG